MLLQFRDAGRVGVLQWHDDDVIIIVIMIATMTAAVLVAPSSCLRAFAGEWDPQRLVEPRVPRRRR